MQHARNATEALIKFIVDHNGSVDSDLRACLYELNAGNKLAAVEAAKRVKPHGMGGITDWWPQPIHEGESSKYNELILLALVNYWCAAMQSLSGS